jgi:hypothetical protein
MDATIARSGFSRQLALFPMPEVKVPFVVADGLGVDSTALLLGLWQRGIVPDLILHADTGGEHPETVAYIPERQRWLASVGFPALVIVRRRPVLHGKMGSYSTLEENCLVNETLPSLAFGFRACSVKWKREPQDAFVAAWTPAKAAWAAGLRVRKAIGYDAGPKDARRSTLEDDARYVYEYPLRVWGWDRERCIAEIVRAGLPVPRKSACFFCPASKASEVAEIVARYPELADRILAIERRAKPHLTRVQGLWRTPIKGHPAITARPARGKKPARPARPAVAPRPGSMTEYILALRAGGPALVHLPVLQPANEGVLQCA